MSGRASPEERLDQARRCRHDPPRHRAAGNRGGSIRTLSVVIATVLAVLAMVTPAILLLDEAQSRPSPPHFG
jgi:hypothetical protein